MNITPRNNQDLTSRHFNLFRPRRRASLTAGRRARFRPWLESLEVRVTPSIDIVAHDIIIDESTGRQKDDVDSSVAPHNTNTTLQYLLGLDSPGGLTSPEVAFKANFVQVTASAGETITSV